MSKKILLIPNMPFWSVDKCAKDLVKYNKSDLILDIMYFDDFIKNWKDYIDDYDLLHPMVNTIFYEFIYRDMPLEKVITSIRSYTSWDKGKTLPPGFNRKPSRSHINRLKKALLVNTISKKLWHIFSKYLRIIHTKYTCDLETFYPLQKKKKNNKLVVGWTGSLSNNGLIRGVHEIIKPACDAVDGIKLQIQCVEDKWIKDDNIMREFYNSLDLYLCASISEGTPRPLLEAAACGVPSLTVDVGIVPELIDDNINGFIVERKVDSFIEKLKYIVKNREILPEMGKKARIKMEKEFNWNDIIFQWTDFFKNALELKDLKQEGFKL